MKKIQLLSIILLLGICCGTYAYIPKEVIFDYSIVENKDVEINDVYTVASKYVPKELFDSFKEYTMMDSEKETMLFCIQILSIGYWESGWKVTRSKQNRDGSYDVGYMMLNTKNIDNQRFMDIYGPSGVEDVSNEFETYLIVCINFYKDLYSRYKSDAVYAYNCGEGRYLNNKIPESTYLYKLRVKECIDKFNIEVNRASEERKKKEALLTEIDKMFRKTIVYLDFEIDHIDTPIIGFQTKVIFFEGRQLFFKEEEDHFQRIYRIGNEENSDYIYIGRIKKGEISRPVFYCKIDGRRYLF